jgi:hypothetical protein
MNRQHPELRDLILDSWQLLMINLYIYTYTMATVDTSNYFTVAVSDEHANTSPIASGSSTPAVPEDKASKKARRDQRIAEAVQRSKVEYTAENVYTERGVRLKFNPTPSMADI